MFLGLLLDLGWPAAALAEMPRRLGLADVEVRVGRELRGAIAAERVHVFVRGQEEPPAASLREAPTAGRRPASVGGRERRLGDVLAIVRRANVPPAVQEVACRAFEALFRAEGKAHGAAAEDVHLHEAGADDALVDIVGAALGLFDLGVTSISCTTPLPLGGGIVQCAHGATPVPGPAVVELLVGVPVVGGPVDRELITPTGAALLRAVVQEFRPLPPMTIERVGHGAGGRQDPLLPNVLRGFLGALEAGPLERTIAILETTLDDIVPQDLPPWSSACSPLARGTRGRRPSR